MYKLELGNTVWKQQIVSFTDIFKHKLWFIACTITFEAFLQQKEEK